MEIGAGRLLDLLRQSPGLHVTLDEQMPGDQERVRAALRPG
jgi:hypothetical protein